jgi:hypothetical protein
LLEFLVEHPQVNVNRVDKTGETCASLIANFPEIDDYHVEVLKLLFKKDYDTGNGPRLLVKLLSGMNLAPKAILWLVKHLQERGAQVKPDERPLVGAVGRARGAEPVNPNQNFTVRAFFQKKLGPSQKNRGWYQDLSEAWRIISGGAPL